MTQEIEYQRKDTVERSDIICPNCRDKICPPSCELHFLVALASRRGANDENLANKLRDSGIPLSLCIRRQFGEVKSE